MLTVVEKDGGKRRTVLRGIVALFAQTELPSFDSTQTKMMTARIYLVTFHLIAFAFSAHAQCGVMFADLWEIQDEFCPGAEFYAGFQVTVEGAAPGDFINVYYDIIDDDGDGGGSGTFEFPAENAAVEYLIYMDFPNNWLVQEGQGSAIQFTWYIDSANPCFEYVTTDWIPIECVNPNTPGLNPDYINTALSCA